MNKKAKDIFNQFQRMPVDEAFVDLLRVRLLETMDADVRMGIAEELVAKRRAPILSMRRLVPAFIVLTLIFTSGGTVFASQVSLPGETLYPVKLLSEEVRVAVALTPAKKAELQVEYAAERTKEIDVVVALHASSTLTASETRDIDHAISNYTHNLEGAGRHADELRAHGDDNEAKKINLNLSEAAEIYHDTLVRTASSTEEEHVREHLREAASSTEALQKKAERESHDEEQDEEQQKHDEEKKTEEEHTTSTSWMWRPKRAERRAVRSKETLSADTKSATSSATQTDRVEAHEESPAATTTTQNSFWFFSRNTEQKEVKPVETKDNTDWESANIEKSVKTSGEKQEVEDGH